MSAEVEEGSTVSFTVKELLTEQTALLRGIDAKVDGKADKADLIPLVRDLREHHGRIQTIEDARNAEAAAAATRATTRRRVWTFTAAVLVPLSTTLIYVFH